MGDDQVYIMDVYNAYIYPGDKKAKRKLLKWVFYSMKLLDRDAKELLSLFFLLGCACVFIFFVILIVLV